jgi:hypothetical protein
MKQIVILVIAFVLLIPLTAFAQESLNCPKGAYHGLDNAGNDACRDIETNKIVKTLTESTTSSSNTSSEENPLSILFKFIENLFSGFTSDPIKKSIDTIEKSVSIIENSVETITDSVPVNLESLSGNTEGGLEDCSKYKNEVKHSSDVDKIFAAVQKTDACEQRNKQISIKQGTTTTQSGNYPTKTLKMDLKPSGGATADFTINTVRVSDGGNYKIININMLMTMHIELNDTVFFSPTAMWVLKSPDGEIYPEQCHGRQFDGQFISGKDNPNRSWDMCFHVEKELIKFDLLKSMSNMGTITLD